MAVDGLVPTVLGARCAVSSVREGDLFCGKLMKRLMKIGAVGGLIVGMILVVGPTEPIHHQLHKRDLKPYFKRCCCANAEHTECAWADHFGKWWPLHHPGFARLGMILMGASGLALLGIQKWGRKRKIAEPAARAAGIPSVQQ